MGVPATVDMNVRRVAPGSAPAGGLSEKVWTLEGVEELIDDCVGGPECDRSARNRAYARALALLEESGADRNTARSALIAFACEVIAGAAVGLTADLPALRRLIGRLQSGPGISAVELGSALIGAPELLRLAPQPAIEVELALLLAFSSSESVSLWRLSDDGRPGVIACSGDDAAADARARRFAARLLSGKPDKQRAPHPDISGVVFDSDDDQVALVCRGSGSASDREPLLTAAARALALALANTTHVARASATDDRTGATDNRAEGPGEQMTAAERRLARVRFDLHDGPQQDLMLLAEDLRLFRSQIDTVLACDHTRAIVLGRFDDLEARLVALEGDLRRISVSAESPFLHRESLAQALARVTDAFQPRSGIAPHVDLHGDLSNLTDSQHLTLLCLIREALANIHEHADAKRVAISVSATTDGVSASVTDDGQGFEPETTLIEAARRGHLGLVGMHERVHMLGGRTQIDSRPGGPTVVSVNLPPAPRSASRRALPAVLS
jgi:signal transduction histidine kinase